VKERATVAKQETVKRKPNPIKYSDLISGTSDDQLTPGGAGRLLGHRLQFEEANPEQGVFFVGTDGGATRIELAIRNMPKELIFVVPSLPPGEYTLQVRATTRSGEDLRTGALDQTLTVAA
jgi:hypothetical protein